MDLDLVALLPLLFEHSPLLQQRLHPELEPLLSTISSYPALIDTCIQLISSWDPEQRARFIVAHPRIGETKSLSLLSASEQGQQQQNNNNTMILVGTPPHILARLAVLNACYERRYPGLVYITFVNGRSRAEVADEMAEKLGGVEDIDAIVAVERGGAEWLAELDHAVADIGLIAHSRLKSIQL